MAKIYNFDDITHSNIAEFTLSSLGESSHHVGQAFGRFDFVPSGLEEASSPVYRQAHSKEVFRKERDEEKFLAEEYLLYRCDRLT